MTMTVQYSQFSQKIQSLRFDHMVHVLNTSHGNVQTDITNYECNPLISYLVLDE